MFGKITFATIYCGLLLTFTIYISFLDWYEFFTSLLTCESGETNFDYIIVGAGTAGSVLALRLSQDPKIKVLLLEAGSEGQSNFLDIPLITPLLHKSIYDWQYKTIPQENACWAFKDNASFWPSGKILGGSGRLNHMLYTRGHPDDYKEWYKYDCDFNYERHILYFFKKSENQVGSQSKDGDYHGKDGPLIVNDATFHSELYEPILEAAKNLNLPVRDTNGKFSTGFSPIQVNLKDGKRYTPIHQVLANGRPNLVIRTQSIVKEVLFRANYEAYGVNYDKSGRLYDSFASKGVILSAGTIGSAKLLLLSGIGPKHHLKSVGIKTKINLPVGKNLQDHLITGFDLVLFDRPLDVHKKLISPIEIIKYFWKQKGILTSVGVDAVAFLNSFCLETQQSYDLCESEFNNRADFEIIFMQGGLNSDFGMRLRHIVGLKSSIWNNYYRKFADKYTVSFLPVLLRPQSRGVVRLINSKFTTKPLINPNYLSNPNDVNVLIKAIRFIKRLVEAPAMKRVGAKFNNIPFPFCNHFTFDTDDYWRCYIKYVSLTVYHPIGTCKMGDPNDQTTVVTPEFKVKGTNKLFVVDGSIIPSLVSANTNAAVAMLAEKAADSIKLKENEMELCCNHHEIFALKRKCC